MYLIALLTKEDVNNYCTVAHKSKTSSVRLTQLQCYESDDAELLFIGRNNFRQTEAPSKAQ